MDIFCIQHKYYKNSILQEIFTITKNIIHLIQLIKRKYSLRYFSIIFFKPITIRVNDPFLLLYSAAAAGECYSLRPSRGGDPLRPRGQITTEG